MLLARIAVFFFAIFLHSFSYATRPILTITPSIISTTLRSDSQTVISYTVTNNTNQTISALDITPNYLTTGNPSGIYLDSNNNNCTGKLVSNASCTFSVIIQGRNQPQNFQITPRVCGYSQTFCSVPITNSYVQINNNQISTNAFAYFSVTSGLHNNSLVPVNGQTLSVGTPFTLSTGETIQNPVTVSSDGNTIYIAEQDLSGNVTILVLSGGTNPRLKTSLSLSYLPYFDALVSTLDGKTLYASGSEAPAIHKITNNNGNYSDELISLPAGSDASGLAVSPDGSRLFIGSYDQGKLRIMDTSSNQIIQTLTNSGTSCEFDAPGAIAVMPSGNTIYVANGYGSEGISVVQKNADGTYSCGNRITDPSEQLTSMLLSSDGHFLYALGVNDPQQLYIIDTTTNTQLASFTVPSGSNGIAVTPDGTHLFISNNAGAYVFSLLNGLPTTNSPSAINIGGGTQTNGSFVG